MFTGNFFYKYFIFSLEKAVPTTMKQLASTLNSIGPQRVVEPYIAKKFTEQEKLVNGCFNVSKIKFSNCDTIRDVVHCKGVEQLIAVVVVCPNCL